MKLIKLLLKLIFTLVLILGTVVAGIIFFVDPNDYKDNIITTVKQQTGRDLSIPGDISFSIYPWLGIKLGEVSISNPETFARPTFAKIDALDVRLSIKQLLSLKPELGVLYLDGLDLTLIKRADGLTNWQDLQETKQNQPKDETETTTETAAKTDANKVLEQLTIAAVEIRNAKVSWLDETQKNSVILSDFNLRTGIIKLAAPLSYDLSFNTELGEPAITAGVLSSGKISVKRDFSSLTLNSWSLSLDVEGESIPAQRQNIRLSGNIIYELEDKLLNLIDIKLNTADLDAIVDIKVENLDTAPLAKGKLIVPEFALSQTLQKLTIDMPPMADSRALDAVSLNADIDASEKRINISNITLGLDDSRIEGDIKVQPGDITTVNYKFVLDEIDVDRYLAPQSDTESTAEASEKTDEPLNLPVDLIRTLNVTGEFTAKAIKIMNLRMRDIEAKNVVRDDIAQIKLQAKKLYSGSGEVLASIDARAKTPAMAAKANMDQIEIGSLLKDYMGKDFMSGKGKLNFNVRSMAETSQQLTATLNGSVSFDIQDGEINGINIAEKLRQAEAKKEGVQYEASREVNSTDFAGLSGSGQIKNGLFTISSFNMAAPLLRANAKGSADIHNEVFDMTFDSYFVNTKTGQAGKDLNNVRSLLVPVKLKGSFSEPELSVDWKRLLLQGSTEKVKQAKAAIQQQKAAAQQQLEQKRAEERARAQQKKAEEEARLQKRLREKEDELKEKLKNKLFN